VGGRTLTKSALVAHRLREDISAGRYPPGGRLEQRDVAARYGTSATPVREALKQLAAEGILVHTPNVGMTVANLAADRIDDLHEVFLMRRALESMATREAHQHLSRLQLSELERVHEAFGAGIGSHDLATIRELNYSFHMQIYRAAAGDRLLRTIEQCWTLFPWDTVAWAKAWLRPPDERQSQHEHGAVLRALQTGTPEEAGEAMGVHIDNSYRSLVAYLRERAGRPPEEQ